MKHIFRAFARNLAKTSKSSPAASEPAEGIHEEDKPAPEIEVSKTWMASRAVFIPSLPPALFAPAKGLFSAYPSETIRDWGAKLSESYTKVNSVEKPMDIRRIQPFATSIKTLSEDIQAPQNRGFYKLPKESLVDNLKDIVKLQQSEDSEQKLPYQKEHAIGYAHTRMPSTYASVYRILHEIKHRIPEFSPKNCIDYGSGTGAASWAASEVFPDAQIIAIEPSKEMRTVGKKLSIKQPNIKWAESLANLPSIANEEGLYDLVICGYVLTEIENPVTRNLILDALWQRNRGVMVFVEPGTPKGFRIIYSIREWCLKTMDRTESSIVAPCPHDGECPLAAHPKSWCHFSQFTAKYPKTVISRAKGERDFANEKFSYIAVQRGSNPRYLSASTELNLAQQSFLWPRLVRPTIKRTKHIVFDICRLNKLERIIISKGRAQKEVYKFLRRAKWGDLWPYKENEYIDLEKRKMKHAKYRLKRKLRGKERRLNEKGQSEGTDIEAEKEKIENKKKGEKIEEPGKKFFEKEVNRNKKVKKESEELGQDMEEGKKKKRKAPKGIPEGSFIGKKVEKNDDTQKLEKTGGRKTKKRVSIKSLDNDAENKID